MKETIPPQIDQLIKQLESTKTYTNKEELHALMAHFELIGEKSFKLNLILKDHIKKQENL